MSNNKNYSKTRMVTLFKRPGIFGAVYVVTIILAVLFIPNLAVKKGFAGLLILSMIYPILREWLPLLRPLRMWLLRVTVRLMRKLRALQKIPVDVMVCYGATAMLWISMLALGVAVDMNILWHPWVMGVSLALLTYAALWNIFFIIRSVWRWSRPFWASIYLLIGSVALWTGRAQASRFTLEITGEPAERFPNFLGLLSSASFVLHLIQFAAVLLAIFALVQLLVIMLASSTGWFKMFNKASTKGRTGFWGRLRTGKKFATAREDGELRALSAFLAPLAYILFAMMAMVLPGKVMDAPSTVVALSHVLVAMEYSSAGACVGEQGPGLYVRIADDRVSSAKRVGEGYAFDSVVCAKPGQQH